jgi:hypothetical protein
LRHKQKHKPAHALLHQLPRGLPKVWLFGRLHTTKFQHIFCALAHQNIDHIVHRHDAQHAPQIVYDGHRQQVILREQVRDLFLVGFGLDNDDVGLHDLFDALTGVANDHIAQRADTD